MKIGNSTEVFSRDPLTGKSNTTPSTTRSSSEASEATTSTTLSSLGGTLSSLQTELSQPAFDAAKVEDIKRAIREGRFNVNAEAVADKLISGVQELLSTRVRA